MTDIESCIHFKLVPADLSTDKAKAARVVMLSDKISYELTKKGRARGIDDAVAIIRVEELTPLSFQQLISKSKRLEAPLDLQALVYARHGYR
ncbi:hypothetical protein GALMADRAFT_144659 [Galerina marginata CBS 339.88]|uniref:2-oxoglutarate dehydrogenase E1 component/KDG C-terminal domain-containing protein n=1 Tax=Galerina marginata (strain CBS 339.88) TaxID=685588 RepID=A0A067SK15_GALM3|nr:hypothetical protein GALMADRAFT_144659 [Galerina marginata CBS 339.88]